MSIVEVLNLRTRFEEVTDDFKLEKTGSDINTLKWFIEHGHKSNSLRNGYQEAYQIAEAIVTEYENGGQENDRGFG
jgi:hypothetical protein